MALEGAQRIGGVPAAVDEQIAIVGAHEIGVDVSKRAVSQRQREAPDAGQQLCALWNWLTSP